MALFSKLSEFMVKLNHTVFPNYSLQEALLVKPYIISAELCMYRLRNSVLAVHMRNPSLLGAGCMTYRLDDTQLIDFLLFRSCCCNVVAVVTGMVLTAVPTSSMPSCRDAI